MLITHWGHACVQLSFEASGMVRRVLIDPGNFSAGAAVVKGLDAVLVTHEHIDHADPELLTVLSSGSPRAEVIGNAPTAAVLSAAGVAAVHAVKAGDGLLDGAVRVAAAEHQPVHPELPVPPSVAYQVAGSVLHPGDGFPPAPGPVDVLLLPVAGPWLRLAEAIDYLRAVRPRVVVPIHQGGLVAAHRALHHGVLRELAPAGTEVLIPETGVPVSV